MSVDIKNYNLYDLGYDKNFIKTDSFYEETNTVESKISNSVNVALVTSGNSTGNVTLTSGFYKSANYVPGVSGWTINADGSSQFKDITLIGGTFKFGKTSWTDSVHSGYYQGAEGLYFGGAADVTKIKFSIATGTFDYTGGTFTTPAILGGSIIGTTIAIGSGNSIFKADANGIYLGHAIFASAHFSVSMAGALIADSATITGSITATSGTIGSFTIGTYLYTGTKTAYNDANAGVHLGSDGIGIGNNLFTVSGAGVLTAVSGTVGGWNLSTNLLQSATSGVRIVLDQANLRISVFDAVEEKVVMGYLNGLPKHDGSGNWGASNYGFWARTGNSLSIDGAGEFTSGDWIVQNDANYLIKDGSANIIVRLGTDTGEKGLFIYNTAGTQLAKFISDQIYVGATTSYLQYTVAAGMKLYSNISDALTFDFGSNVLFKKGGSIKFTSVTAPTACTATLIATGTGNVDNGDHSYKVTFVTAAGETSLSSISNVVTVDGTHKQVALSGIPVSTSGAVLQRKIYRTKAGGTNYYLLTTINNNSVTTYTDNTADASLTGGVANNLQNDTAGKIYIDGQAVIDISNQNIYIGVASGTHNTVGYGLTAMGYGSLHNNTIGQNCDAYGLFSLYSNTEGILNSAFGGGSLYSNTVGGRNVASGCSSQYYNIDGSYNTSGGVSSLQENIHGSYLTGFGYMAGYLCENSNALFLGYMAGSHETAGNVFYLDAIDRGSLALEKAGALLYGTFNATPANQTLVINAATTISNTLNCGAITTLGDLTARGLNTGRAIISETYNDNSASTSKFRCIKSHQDTVGYTATVDTEILGILDFYGVGSDADSFDYGGEIKFTQNGAAGATFIPTKMTVELMTAAGASFEALVLAADKSAVFAGAVSGITTLACGAITSTSDIKANTSQYVLEGYATGRNVLRAMAVQIQPGATPGTNINIGDMTITFGTFNCTNSNATNLAKSATSGSWSLSSNGLVITFSITPTILTILSHSVQMEKLNTAALPFRIETYISAGNICLVITAVGSTTALDWTTILDAGSYLLLNFVFLTSD